MNYKDTDSCIICNRAQQRSRLSKPFRYDRVGTKKVSETNEDFYYFYKLHSDAREYMSMKYHDTICVSLA